MANTIARLAEDAAAQLEETDHWLDSVDLVILDALEGGGNYTKRDALEFTLTAHARIRRQISVARVAA